MKEKDFSVCLLYDIYSPLISEKKRTVFELSFWEDMSLSEIAEITGITRQGVRDRIVKGEEIILDLEKKLGLAGRFGNVHRTVDRLVTRLQELQAQGIEVADLIETVKDLDN